MFSLFQPLSLVAQAVGALPSASRAAPRVEVDRQPVADDPARLSIELRAFDRGRQG